MKMAAACVGETQGGFGGGVQEQSRLIINIYIVQSQREGLVEMFANYKHTS